MADRASLEAQLCSERFGSRAARGCYAAADGSLQWEAWGWRWWGFSEVFKVEPEGRDGGGGRASGTASPFLSRLLTVFLPQGFPDSVSPDYLSYQLWDSVQVSGAVYSRGVRETIWATSSSPFRDWRTEAQSGAVCHTPGYTPRRADNRT